MNDAPSAASPPVKTSRVGLIAFLAGTGLIVLAIGYRAFHPVETPEMIAAAQHARPTIDQLQARADKDPRDAKAWQELAYAQFSGGAYEQAAKSYRQAIEGDPKNAVLWSAMGESLVMASVRDPMPPAAVSAFEKAYSLDPGDPRARYFLAVRKDLSGDHKGALADWLALLKQTPPGAVWEGNLRRTIEQVGTINKIDTAAMMAKVDQERAASAPGAPPVLTAGAAIPGPTQDQITSARGIAPSDQQKMAEGMVERLASRLKSEPGDVNGWVMLMRSRMTLGQPDQASQALSDAIAANPREATRLRSEADILGVH